MTPTCRFCGSSVGDLVSREVAGATDCAVYRCRDCDLVYLYPIMTEAEEAVFYRQEFEKYMEGRSGPGWKTPETHFISYQAEGERRVSLVRDRVGLDDDVLEIGSSTGYFLDDLKPLVRSVTGVEPGEVFRRFATSRGFETVATLDDLGPRRFDVIVMYYVLEHLRDPVEYLIGLRPRLKPGGRLLIEVPNVDDVLVSTYHIPAFPPFYWNKAHYQNFSHVTLLKALARAGYTAALFPAQRYDLSNHVVWMMEGKPGGMGRYKHVFTPELEAAYADALKAAWRCDTIFAVATVAGEEAS